MPAPQLPRRPHQTGRRVLVTGLGTFWGGRIAQALEADPTVDVIIELADRPGTVVLIERKVRLGDMVKVDTFTGRVHDIRTRFTVIRALDGVEHIVLQPEECLRRGATPLFGSAIIAKLALGNFAFSRWDCKALLDEGAAAIGSRLAGELYGAPALAERIAKLIGDGSSSYSSSISPTMVSSRSSTVTMPIAPPYSSTTTAIGLPAACSWTSRSMA